jgi:hypothetical protein
VGPGLYRRLGPEEFYRRRLEWLAANGKTTSYHRLVVYLKERRLNVPIPPLP